MPTYYDAIVIGAGQAGPPLAVRLAAAGKKTALIERQHLGGTCVNDGCTPTKTLVASARAAHVMRRAGDFGIDTHGAPPFSMDMRKVKARKDTVVRASLDSLAHWIDDTEGLTLIRANARFIGKNLIEVGSQQLEAPMIFINVGARAVRPHIKGLGNSGYLTNTEMLEIDRLPGHLAIIGGSYIALEFAQMYRRFGSKVTVFAHGSRLVSREDEDVSDAVKEVLVDEGVQVKLSAEVIEADQRAPDQYEIHYRDRSGTQQMTASHLLVAIGRTPNTDELGLERAGVQCDASGYIVVDDKLETNVPGLYALGDVNGRGAFTHTSYNDFEIVAGNLLDGRNKKVSDRVPTYAMYIDPPLARAGMTAAEVLRSNRPALVATMPMSRVGRARERSEELGFMKVLVDAESKQILGATLLGIEADEVVQQLLLAMSAKLPYTTLSELMGIHPTVSELLPTLFQALKPLKANEAESADA